MDSSLLLVVFVSSYILCNSSVISVGLHVAPTMESKSTDITSITLYWHNDEIVCQIIPSSYDTWYHCNTSTFISYQTNCQPSQRALTISIPINDGLWIDEIEIYDHNNNRYHYSTFCSSLTFPFGQPTNSNCINYQFPAWNVFCIGDHCNNYNSLNIDLSYNTEASISQNVTQSETSCTNINPTISPTSTVNPPKLGVTLPRQSMPSPTQSINHGVVFETTKIISTSVGEVISTINQSQSFNFMSVLLPTLFITICVCFLSVVCFLICNKRKQEKQKRHKKSTHPKRVEMEMQQTYIKSQQILISDHLNGIHINNTHKITLVENSISDCEEFVGSKTNSKMEGRGFGDFLQSNIKKAHKATFDSMAVAQYSLPVSPMQSPHRKPIDNNKMPVIIASDEDSEISDSLYLEEKKNEHNELRIELGLKDLGKTIGGDTPGDTPVTPGDANE